MASYWKIKKEVDRKKDQLINLDYFASIHKKQYFYWLREQLGDMLNTGGAKHFFGLAKKWGEGHEFPGLPFSAGPELLNVLYFENNLKLVSLIC